MGLMSGKLSKLLSFVRLSRNDALLSESKVDPGGGANITGEHFDGPGEDAHPIEGDIVAILPIPRSNGDDGVAVGYADIQNEKKAARGDKRIYARGSDGVLICEIWLKNDGEILIDNFTASTTMLPNGTVTTKNDVATVVIKNDGTMTATNGTVNHEMNVSGKVETENGVGRMTLEPGGTVDINTLRIDPQGNLTTPGTIVSAISVSAPALSAGGGGAGSGSISCQGDIQADGDVSSSDVISGGKSFNSHTHGGR